MSYVNGPKGKGEAQDGRDAGPRHGLDGGAVPAEGGGGAGGVQADPHVHLRVRLLLGQERTAGDL